MIYNGIKITKRADGRWMARFQRNKIKHCVYAKTQKECLEKLKLELKAIKSQVINSNTMLHEWLDYFLKTYKSENKSKENEITVRLHIKPNIKNIALHKITANDIQELMNIITLSRTRVTAYNIMNNALECAVMNHLINENPCKYIKRPKHERNIGSALTIEEEQQLLDKIINKPYENVIKFLLYSGMRRNEVLTLTGKDIDMDKNKIHVRGTKTQTSDRYIPIFPKLKEILNNMEYTEEQYLFNYAPATLTHIFLRLEIPNHKLHDLRHTFATRCIEHEIPMKYVQSWLGHTSFKTTADIYSHVNSDTFEQLLIQKLK